MPVNCIFKTFASKEAAEQCVDTQETPEAYDIAGLYTFYDLFRLLIGGGQGAQAIQYHISRKSPAENSWDSKWPIISGNT